MDFDMYNFYFYRFCGFSELLFFSILLVYEKDLNCILGVTLDLKFLLHIALNNHITNQFRYKKFLERLVYFTFITNEQSRSFIKYTIIELIKTPSSLSYSKYCKRSQQINTFVGVNRNFQKICEMQLTINSSTDL